MAASSPEAKVKCESNETRFSERNSSQWKFKQSLRGDHADNEELQVASFLQSPAALE